MASIDSTLDLSIFDTISDSQIQKMDSVTTASDNETLFSSVKKEPFLSDWSVVFIIVAVALFASVRVTSGKYFHFLIQSSLNRQTANRLYRERINNILHPSFRLDILFNLTLGLYLLHVESYFFSSFIYSELVVFLLNVLILLMFNLSKFLLYRLSGLLFKCQNEISEYIFYSKSSNRIMGVFLFPIAVLLLFQNGIWRELSLFIGLITILILSVSSLYKGIRIIGQKDISIYYLILYLCSLEILPLLIVWRILLNM
ncbi:MAG: DUF4271 domain-containing protein [Prolixibacteraceae bacterium]|jgi:hypothetical protein|nr:DUF4271 domain-containing protein [Prolixibacteraceae bacterium]